MKKALLMTALAGAMMANDIPVSSDRLGGRSVKKSQLTNKQKKARAKSKRAKKARK